MREESSAALIASRVALAPQHPPLDEHPGGEQWPMWVCRFSPQEPGGWGQHRHRQHQLAWVSTGVATVHVGERMWVVPPTQAMWIPSGWPHDVVNRRPATLHCFYVWPDRSPATWTEPTLLAITPMLRELILLLADDHEVPVGDAAATLLFSQLAPVESAPLRLPMPTSPAARELADRLLADPAAALTLEEWARRQHTSVSTLRRSFPHETGLTFSEWRRQARLHASLQLLADGLSVERVAARVGYTSTTGYIDAFKRHFGTTPARHTRAARDEA